MCMQSAVTSWLLNTGWHVQVSHFRGALSKSLAMLARKYATDIAEQEADRLTPILTSLGGRYARLLCSSLGSAAIHFQG